MKFKFIYKICHSEQVSCIFYPAPRAGYNTSGGRPDPACGLCIPDIIKQISNLQIKFIQLQPTHPQSGTVTSLYGISVESILLTPTISCFTPRVKASNACSRV